MEAIEQNNDVPFMAELRDLQLSVEATSYKKGLISIHLNQTKEWLKQDAKMDFLPDIKFEKPPFANDAWFRTQSSHLKNLQKHIYLRYIEDMEKQVSHLNAILSPGVKGPLLLPYCEKIRQKSMVAWGVADEDHITKQGLIDGALELAELYWTQWISYGIQKAQMEKDLIGTGGIFSLPHSFTIQNY